MARRSGRSMAAFHFFHAAHKLFGKIPQTLPSFTREQLTGFGKLTNAGASWARVSVPNWTISALLLDPRRPGRIILGVEGLGVYVTRDAGATFMAINEGFSHRQVRELVTDPQQSARMLLVLTNAVESIYATNDAGRTWSAIGHNASTQTLRHVYAAPEPASSWWATPQSGGLLRYEPSRATWVQTGVIVTKSSAPAARTTKAASGKTPAPAPSSASARTSAFSKPLHSQIYDIAFSANLWLAATSDGLIASRDHGATWSEFDSYSKTSSAPHAAVRVVKNFRGRKFFLGIGRFRFGDFARCRRVVGQCRSFTAREGRGEIGDCQRRYALRNSQQRSTRQQ